jgi:hypothetical protein
MRFATSTLYLDAVSDTLDVMCHEQARIMIYVFLDYELNTSRYELCRAGITLHIEPKTFDLLLYLIEHHVEHGKQIVFDDQTFVERGAYKSVTQTSVNGVYPSGIPFCHDDDEINQYMNQHLNWQNGDALILMGYYDEEKINRMFEEVQQKMGFCGIEEAELDLYHAVSS